MRLAIFLLIFSLILRGYGESKMCTYGNECAGEVSTPYCVEGRCVNCQTNIDCSSPGYFCRDGSCVSAYSGMPCNSLEFKADGSPILPVLGQTDQLFCGSLIYQGNQIGIEWMGFCIHGKCAECVPNYDLSLLNQETRNFFNEHWDRTLMFPGTMCENNKVASIKSDLRSKLESAFDVPLVVVVSILILLLLICLLLGVIVMCYSYYSAKKHTKQKSM